MKENNILPLAPCRVKIIKCSGEQFWYKNLIGEEYGVDNASGVRDFVLWEDYVNKRTMWRHIAQQDCEVVNRISGGFYDEQADKCDRKMNEAFDRLIVVSGDDRNVSVFPVAEMNERIKYLTAVKPSYVIGVDTYDKGNYAYCLMVKVGRDSHVVLANTRHNEDDFNEEVANLAKYFNAEVIKG